MRPTIPTILLSALLLASCATTDPAKRIPQSTPLTVTFDTREGLYSGEVLAESGITGFTSRIAKYLGTSLSKHAITTAPDKTSKGQDPKLTINLTTVEALTGNRPGPFFSTIAFREIKVKYTVALQYQDTKLFEYEDERKDESLDKVASKIADQAAGKVINAYTH